MHFDRNLPCSQVGYLTKCRSCHVVINKNIAVYITVIDHMQNYGLSREVVIPRTKLRCR